VSARHGLKIHNFYGSTECGGIAYDRSELPRAETGGVGQPMANVSLSLADSGCLTVAGSNVGETYWPQADAALAHGRFQTSDLAEMRDGWVFLRGRASDLINVAGRKVAPETIEEALRAHPGVRSCLVVGVPAEHDTRAEMILACVVGDPGVTEPALRSSLLSRLPAWQIPRAWWFVDDLEADARGKVARAEWRRRYLAGSRTRR
jgi:acyl-CoA synthetase (AMP-forming)/AMP-acid ligase II